MSKISSGNGKHNSRTSLSEQNIWISQYNEGELLGEIAWGIGTQMYSIEETRQHLLVKISPRPHQLP